MKIFNSKQLRAINYLSIVIAIALWILFFNSDNFRNSAKDLSFLLEVSVNLLFLLFSLLISLKSTTQKGVLLFALFLSLISQNGVLPHLYLLSQSSIVYALGFLSSAVTGTVFIKSMQSFPRQLTAPDVKRVFSKKRIVNNFLKWSLKRYTWAVFPLLILSLAVLSIPLQFLSGFENLVILIIAALCLFVNYKNSTGSEQNKILWFFWGFLVYTFLRLIEITIALFHNENTQAIQNVIASSETIVMTISLVMSLFFYDTFNTGIIVRRTIVDSSIFTLIVIIYNTLEHYCLHWLSHQLHLSDVLVASFFSGILVMVFSPLHHKMMHFLGHRIKKHPAQHTEADMLQNIEHS